MQSADPENVWWRELTGQTNQANIFDRGPGVVPVDARELVPRVSVEEDVPEGGNWYDEMYSDPSRPRDGWNPTHGHANPFLDAAKSYFWGVPYLMQQINRKAKNARCCELTRKDLIDAAVDYNGGGDPRYRQKITDAVNLMGCME